MPRSIRIATFNLENLDDRPGIEPALDARIAVLRPQLQRLDADVLCLQEVNGQPRTSPRRLRALERLVEDTPYARHAVVSTTSPSGEGVRDRHNLVILSRFPVRSSCEIRHELVAPLAYRRSTARPPATVSEPVEWDRPALHAALDLGDGRTLHVVDLHLRAPLASFVPGQKAGAFAWHSVGGWAEGFFLSAVRRTGQALEVRLFVERLMDADPQALVAVCGDFNAEDGEMPVRVLCAAPEDTGSGRLAMRALVPSERLVPRERRYSVLHAGRRVMLDHILVSRPLLAWHESVEIHNEGLADELVGYANEDRSPESYHAPLVAAFALPDVDAQGGTDGIGAPPFTDA